MRRRRMVSVLLALALGITILEVEPATAGPGRPSGSSSTGTATAAPGAARVDDSQRPDLVSAQLVARRSGHRVEITGLREESSTTWANPDGTLTSQLAAGPVRVKAAGGWQDIDTTLVAEATGVHPKVAVGGARLSGGGDRALVQAALPGGRRFALEWPGVLPAPSLSGNTATYPGVVAGGDLVLQALPGGVELSLVLRQRPVGGSFAPVRLPLVGDATVQAAVDTTRGGGLRLRDAGGRLLGAGPPPLMFGATRNQAGEPTRQAKLDMTVDTPTAAERAAGQRPALVLAPDAGFLADAGVAYPVTIDPVVSWLPASDTYVQADHANDNYSGSTGWVTGTTNGGGNKARSLVTFNTNPLLGKHIIAATVHAFNFQSATCTSSSGNPLRVHAITGGWDPATVTWSTQPNWSNTVSASSAISRQGTPSCLGGVPTST